MDKEAHTANTGLAKVAVQCSADTFVVNQTLVLRINTCLPAGRFVVKIATFANRENVIRHALAICKLRTAVQ